MTTGSVPLRTEAGVGAADAEKLNRRDPADGNHTSPGQSSFPALLIGSIGVVYGDIGTSPLYALQQAMKAAGASQDHMPREDVLGILSLILWALTIIVTFKYVTLLLRADNQGEGGTLSLMALAQRAIGTRTRPIFFLGLCGAAMFFGDAMITPAISVLSAVEGLKLISPHFEPYVLVITLVIIVALFAAQSGGTARVASLFGPIMLVWMLIMAAGGIAQLFRSPSVLAAFNPLHAIYFLSGHGMIGMMALGAVFLAVTGAEALYADLGHFGRKPIQAAWLLLVFPALTLNYLGQGALLIADPSAIENPFFRLYPAWALALMVAFATLATIIASQAVITGAFSLTRQAIQLKLLPRLEIIHTSQSQEGQIYMPQVNTLLLIGVVAIVVLFGSSEKLGAAYGISITGTMVVTVCLLFLVAWKHWKAPVWAAALLVTPFLIIDLIFLGANMIKVFEGGYVPLAIAAGSMVAMWTWTKGVQILTRKAQRQNLPLQEIVEILEKKMPQQVPGAAVFLTSDSTLAPPSLMHSLKHYKVLHAQNVMLTVQLENIPHVAESERVRMEQISANFLRVFMRFGYMDKTSVPRGLALCRKEGWKFDIMSTSFFLSRWSFHTADKGAMPRWQSKLFILLARNATDASEYFQIPTSRVVEIGTQLTL